VSEMIERVAKKISRAMCDSGMRHGNWGKADPGDWADFLPHARAAIEAMREPNKYMLDAGISKAQDCIDSDYDSGPDGESYRSYERLRSDAPSQIWKAMIDTALEL